MKGNNVFGNKKEHSVNTATEGNIREIIVVVSFGISILSLENKKGHGTGLRRKYTIMDRIPSQVRNMADLLDVSDEDCRNKLQMDRNSFYRLCYILQTIGGLKSSKHINVFEKVAMFLSILVHHSKNRCVKFQFKRSGQTVSQEFHSVLRSVLKLHSLLLVKPLPVPEDSNDTRWGKFKGCLGALNGTHIEVHVPSLDKGRYRNRMGQVSINVMAVCDMNMSFVYVLTGWEGSAADSRVLRDAVNQNHGLKVPRGNFDKTKRIFLINVV